MNRRIRDSHSGQQMPRFPSSGQVVQGHEIAVAEPGLSSSPSVGVVIRQVLNFVGDDVAFLSEAAFSMRGRLSKPEERLFGYVLRLKRSETEEDGTVTIRASVDRKSPVGNHGAR